MTTSAKRIALFLSSFLIAFSSFSQVPDDINGRLWRLAKIWGFAKYYHPNTCDVDWNTLLTNTIPFVLNSNSNASFNEAIFDMLSEAGNIPTVPYPLVNTAEVN